VNDDDPVEVPAVARFDDEGGLDDEDAGPARAFEPPGLAVLIGQDEGMDEPVHEPAGGRVGENEPAQGGPVDSQVGPQDTVAEPGDHALPGGPAGAQEVMGGRVGGIDDAAFIGEKAGDDGLAAGDASGQGDPEDAISSWPSF
jgi:hypothetical protein